MKDHLKARFIFLVMLIALIASACSLGSSSDEQPQELEVTDVPTNQATLTLLPTRTAVAGVPTSLPVPTTSPFQPLPATSVFLPPATRQPLPSVTPLPVSIFILSPIPGNVVSGNVQVIGSATHPQFLQYQLEYGPDPNGSNLWYPITGAVQSPVFNSLLGIWNTSVIPDGSYQLRLRVFLRDGTDWGTVVVNGVRVQNQAPTPVPSSTPVIPRPIAAFALSPSAGNAPLNVQFTNQSSGQITTYAWSFGDGTTSNQQSPTHTFNNPGTYNVNLQVTGPGGTSNVTRQVLVNSVNPPIAAFTQDKVSGPAPLTVQFTDQSSGGQITTYAWNFGDGGTSAEKSPSHQFANVGTYNVILTVSGPGGSGTVTRQITVGNPIQASISAEPDSNNSLKLNVSAAVTGGSGTYSSYSWDFGDGQQLLGQNSSTASVTYAASGTYTITLTVRDSQNNEKTVTQPVSVLPQPELVADFSVQQAVTDDPNVSVTGSAQNGSGNYTYAWDFGDGQSSPASADPNASVVYAASGTYTITLTVTDTTDSDTATIQKQVNVVVAPQPELAADFSLQQAVADDPNVSVIGSAQNGSGNYTYAWDFGDGQSSPASADPNASVVYAASGTYTITLTVTDTTDSDTATIQKQVNVVVAPQPELAADFSLQQAVADDPNVSVIGSAQNGSGNYTYAWDFGDGQSSPASADPNASVVYAASGTYTITLTVTDTTDSDTATIQKQVNVVVAPQPELAADFSVQQAVADDPNVSVTGSAQNGSGNYTYAWDFGDGQSSPASADPNASVVYVASGTYTITLTVTDTTDSSTATSQKQVNVVVAPQPELAADFSVQQAVVDDPNVSVTGSAQNGSGNYTYAWDFGDGQSSPASADPNASVVYVASGTYTITLTVTDTADSSTATRQKQVNVVVAPQPELAADFSVQQAVADDPNVSVTGSAQNGSGNYTYAWDFGDGQSSPASADPNASVVYAASGTYTITLTVTDTADSSTATRQKQVNVVVVALEPLVVVIESSKVDAYTYNFVATATGGTGNYTYNWQFGDGQSDSRVNDPNTSVTYGATGTYTIDLTVDDGNSTESAQTMVAISLQDTTPILPDINNLNGDLRPIYESAITAGRDANAFALVGDNVIDNGSYLDVFGNGSYTLDGSVSDLQGVIDRFNTSGSFGAQSTYSNASQLLAPSGSCAGMSNLACEITSRNAVIVLINVGRQDALNGVDEATFRGQMNQIIQEALNQNAIPVLFTVYPSGDSIMQSNITAINQAIINAANNTDGGNGRRVPVINTWRGFDGLSGDGLNGESPSADAQGAGFISNNPTAGFNAWNYYTLAVLRDIANIVMVP